MHEIIQSIEAAKDQPQNHWAPMRLSGSYSILAPVHPRFQLLVCIKASDVKQMPLPFLNRSLDKGQSSSSKGSLIHWSIFLGLGITHSKRQDQQKMPLERTCGFFHKMDDL